MSWIIEHLQWIFSGVGVFLLAGLLGLRSKKRPTNQDSTHNINVVFSEKKEQRETTPEQQGYIPLYDQVSRIKIEGARLKHGRKTDVILVISWKITNPYKFSYKSGRVHPLNFMSPAIVSETRKLLVSRNKTELYEKSDEIQEAIKEKFDDQFCKHGLTWITSFFEAVE